MKRRTRRTGAQAAPKAESLNNLFQIEDGHHFVGNRANNIHVDMLADQLLKLPVDKTKSIFIPLSVAANKNAAVNFFLAAKRRVYKINKNSYYTARYIESPDKKSYLGTRVWRLA